MKIMILTDCLPYHYMQGERLAKRLCSLGFEAHGLPGQPPEDLILLLYSTDSTGIKIPKIDNLNEYKNVPIQLVRTDLYGGRQFFSGSIDIDASDFEWIEKIFHCIAYARFPGLAKLSYEEILLTGEGRGPTLRELKAMIFRYFEAARALLMGNYALKTLQYAFPSFEWEYVSPKNIVQDKSVWEIWKLEAEKHRLNPWAGERYVWQFSAFEYFSFLVATKKK